MYISDKLDDFEFHDAVAYRIEATDNQILFDLKCLNIHSTAPQNPYFKDMEIPDARILFNNAQAESFTPYSEWNKNSNGVYQAETEIKSLIGSKAKSELLNNQKGFDIYGLHVLSKDNRYFAEFSAGGSEPYFEFIISFSSVQIEWSDYPKEAWYESALQYEKQLAVSENGNVQFMPLNIILYKDQPKRTVSLRYNGKNYLGEGEMLSDALFNLASQIPSELNLISCISCRFGNFCPTGSEDNEIFCMNDIEIHKREDLFFYTENEEERKKRRKALLFYCKKYQPICKSYYTYNDFNPKHN